MSEWSEFKEKVEHCLCPPGEGVYTVHTAGDRKDLLQKRIYGTTGAEARQRWLKSLDGFPLGADTAILGVASDCGGGILRGANWGPLYVRQQLYADRPDLRAFDLGDVRVIPHLLRDEMLSSEQIRNSRQALYQDPHSPYPVAPLSIAESIASSFHRALPSKKIFTIGGDHSVSYPLVKEYLRFKKSRHKRTAVIHFDAHTDMLEHRLGVEICFGTWSFHILKELHSPGHLIQLGIRASGKEKSHWENTYGIKQYWAQEIEKAPGRVADALVEYLKKEFIQELYVSFDIDALDTDYAQATGTPEPNGLSPHSAMLILQTLFEHFPITGADMMEVAPFISYPKTGSHNLEPESTLMLASQFSSFLIDAMNQAHS